MIIAPLERERKYAVEDQVTADPSFQFIYPLDFNFGCDFCLFHCETILEEKPPCKTVQQEVTGSPSELGIEHDPKGIEQGVPFGTYSSYVASLSITDKAISEIEKQTKGQTNNKKCNSF